MKFATQKCNKRGFEETEPFACVLRVEEFEHKLLQLLVVHRKFCKFIVVRIVVLCKSANGIVVILNDRMVLQKIGGRRYRDVTDIVDRNIFFSPAFFTCSYKRCIFPRPPLIFPT